MSVVDDIKSRVDLVDIVSQTVKLRRAGKNYTGFCPFHSNTRTPAFVVFPETQTWRCFGQCNEGGDLFSYLMKREAWDFNEALKYLADKAGITLQPLTPEVKASQAAREGLAQVLEAAVEYYRKQMLESEPGKAALDYLHKRGLSDETIKIWGLGYAPAGWNDLSNALYKRGYKFEQLAAAGLLTERDDGSSYDKFRNRLMFPIRDAAGKMAGFGGRVLDPDDLPKYMNSPKTDLFDKGRLLYGLDMAKRGIRSREQAVLVEGYMDVIGLHQAGFDNAVSAMGTALTEDQFKLLKRYTQNIVLALDPDDAGERATLKGLETARQSMDQDAEIHFDTRGLMRVEKRLNADIRVTTLPEGCDPDEIVLEDPQSWNRVLAEAKPIVVHVMQTLAGEADLNDAKVKRELALKVLPLIEDVADGVEREAYRQTLADLLRIDVRALGIPQPAGRGSRRSQAGRGMPVSLEHFKNAAQRNRLLEDHALRSLIQDPDSFYKLNRNLSLLGLSSLTGQDFHESDLRMGFEILVASLQQDELSPQDYLRDNLPEVLIGFLEPAEEPEDQRTSASRRLEDQLRNVLRLRRNLVEARIQEIRFLQSDEEVKPYSQEEAQFLTIEQLTLRRMIDLALDSPLAGGSGRANETTKRRPRI